MLADLHIHTTASDGLFTPTEIVKKAYTAGLKGIAITDHDTVDGIEEALKAGKKFSLTVVPGIELSCFLDNYEVHILGYFIDYKNKDLCNFLKKLQEERKERVVKIITKLKNLGYNISLEEVKTLGKGSSVGRVHIAQVLVKSGYFKNTRDVFDKLLGANCPGYVPRRKIYPEEAVELIKKFGGVPVLAHPGLLENFKLIEKIIKKGILGLEVHYPEHNKETVSELLKLADKYNLIVTGGSDFHGEFRESRIGHSFVNYKVIEELLAYSKKLKC